MTSSTLPQISIDQLAAVTGGANGINTDRIGQPGHAFHQVQDGLSITCVNNNASLNKPDWQCNIHAIDRAVTLRPGKPVITKAMTNGISDEP